MFKHFLKVSIIIFFVISCDTETSLNAPPDDEDPKTQMANFSYISNNVFDQSCAISGCHLNVQNPILKSDVAYNNIVNKPSSTGMDYIEPGDPDQSYLYLKIIGASGINGVRMPRGSSALPQATQDSIRVWIEQGALNN